MTLGEPRAAPVFRSRGAGAGGAACPRAVRTPSPTGGCGLGGLYPQRGRKRVEAVLLGTRKTLMSPTSPYKNCRFPKSVLGTLLELQRYLRIDHLSVR